VGALVTREELRLEIPDGGTGAAMAGAVRPSSGDWRTGVAAALLEAGANTREDIEVGYLLKVD
jgi:hypothetical protein